MFYVGKWAEYLKGFSKAARTVFLLTPTVVFRKWSNSSKISVPVSLIGCKYRVITKCLFVTKASCKRKHCSEKLGDSPLTSVYHSYFTLTEIFSPAVFIAIFFESYELLASCHSNPFSVQSLDTCHLKWWSFDRLCFHSHSRVVLGY